MESMNYAKIDENNKVINIIVASPDWINEQPDKENYIEYFLENPASKEGYYIDGYFYEPQPFSSWTRNGSGSWVSPTPKPKGDFYWDEDSQDWLPFT
jgi:hypothetical protein